MNGTALHGELERTTQRWPVATAAKVDRFVKERVQAATQVQSRKVLAAARAELARRALASFARRLYEDERVGGELWNVGEDLRILIATPWSRTQHAAYGLTDHDARILRAWLVRRLDNLPGKYQWLHYAGGKWFVNFGACPDQAAALAWLAKFGPTADDWADAAELVPRRGGGAR